MPPHAIATFLRACARRRLATAGLLGVVVTSTAHAQVVLDPAFSSDTVGAGEYAPGLTTDYLIREAYGRRAGDNLFHRFSRFDIPTGQSATFVEDAPGSGIRRVVAHVGGATVTRIDGVLRSTIPGADLYLYNARGVVVGPEGRLDLQGSFHASTASDLHFADGVRFGDSTPGAVVTLTSADPTAWGFLSTPAPITLEGDTLAGRAASLVVPDDATLSLVGGAITIDGPGAPGSTPSLAAPSGTWPSSPSVQRARSRSPTARVPHPTSRPSRPSPRSSSVSTRSSTRAGATIRPSWCAATRSRSTTRRSSPTTSVPPRIPAARSTSRCGARSGSATRRPARARRS
ncbi:MAG: filamentous hemagglutinin N-terminal domain-containing protein [Myxococcota bacterium]